MAMGKPVIATGWSGNMEFMDADSAGLVDFTLVPVREGDYPAGKGQRWADAHLPVAAAWMRRLADDRAFAAALGQAGRGRVEAILSPQAAASGIIERVRQLQANTRTAQDTMQTMKHEAGNE
jgi:glycosyltransferase involved in cell wall biosynthesis